AIIPEVDAAIRDDAARAGQAGEPVYRIDLVHHPLVRDARRVRPEEAILEVLARIPRLGGQVDEEPLPVRVLLLERGDELRAPPAARLVDVPRHLGHDDVAELPRPEVLAGHLVVGRAAAL